MLVTVGAYKKLRIYNPNGLERPVLTGRIELEGEEQKVRGNAWLVFRTQRGFGLPIKRRPRADNRIEADLEEAEYFGDITVVKLESGGEENAA